MIPKQQPKVWSKSGDSQVMGGQCYKSKIQNRKKQVTG